MKKMIYMGLIFGASAVYMDLRIFEIKKILMQKELIRIMKTFMDKQQDITVIQTGYC